MNQKVCKGCYEVFIDFDGKDCCQRCMLEKKAKEEDKCLSCGGPGVKDENWGCCEKC